MKKTIIVIFILLSFQLFAGEGTLEKPSVDNRVELLSIVFRLAGNKEYSSTNFKLYTDRIEKHFSPYKNHELIRFAQKMKNEFSISYEAPMTMAVNLDDNLNPLQEFHNGLPRWEKDNATEFVTLLQKFYNDARCNDFFNNNKDLFSETVDRFNNIYKNVDLNWYSSFFGIEPGKFSILIGLGNGGQCYGASVKNSEAFAIMGVWDIDGSGMPVFKTDAYLPLVIHEFNHSFINNLLEKNKAAFKNIGEQIFNKVRAKMQVQANSNWEIMLNEALVRASTIKYFKDHGINKQVIDNMIQKEIDLGFVWIKGLVAELDNYSTQRNTYPTLESFMPKIAEAYRAYSEAITENDTKNPKVESIDEFKNGDTNVSPTIKTITVNFDKALLTDRYSVFLGPKGKDAFPTLKKCYFSDSKKFIMEVELQPNKEYQFILVGKNFVTPDGLGLIDCEVNFKTK